METSQSIKRIVEINMNSSYDENMDELCILRNTSLIISQKNKKKIYSAMMTLLGITTNSLSNGDFCCTVALCLIV